MEVEESRQRVPRCKMNNAILIIMVICSNVVWAEITHPKSMNDYEKNQITEVFDDLNARLILIGNYDLATHENRNFVGEVLKIGDISCLKYNNFPVLAGGAVLIIEYYPKLNFYRWKNSSIEEAAEDNLIWNYVNFFDSSERELLSKSYIIESKQLMDKAQKKLEEYTKRFNIDNVDPFK